MKGNVHATHWSSIILRDPRSCSPEEMYLHQLLQTCGQPAGTHRNHSGKEPLAPLPTPSILSGFSSMSCGYFEHREMSLVLEPLMNESQVYVGRGYGGIRGCVTSAGRARSPAGCLRTPGDWLHLTLVKVHTS